MAISGSGGCLLALIVSVILKLIVAQNYQVTFTIKEEMPPDSFVGDVSSSFASNIPREEINHIKYSFLQDYIQALLSLQQTTGVLSTAGVIDRESKTVCQSQTSCSFNFDIAVKSSRQQSSFFEIISVTLIIEDINDNAPLFPHSLVLLDIPESARVGTSFHIDSAIDLDAGINSVQGYEIGQKDGNFSLDVIQKLDGSFTVKLVLKSLLDRESKDKYNIVIIAMDGGNPKKFGAVSVNVTVTDANDNDPIFDQTSYNITVRENVTIGSTVLTVTARDKDTGNNGRITYGLSENQLDTRVNSIFEISPNDGELKLKDELVYESGTSYKIIVEASDNGKQPRVTQAIVKVHIIDVGNNPPSLQINLLEQGNSKFKNILESANPGTFVAHINVVDTDTNENGEVECEISDKKFELRRMGRKGYKAVVKSRLDRETEDLHNVIVSCHDFGTPALTASSSFLVSVLDENDCAPIFTRPIFTGIIPENLKDFRTFVQIIAFDEDFGKNGEVRYYIDEESTPYKFRIDERDGSLKADQIFDREETPMITFKVIARDLGKPSLSNKATVQLTIEDKNDNAPRIDDPKNFSIPENKNSGSTVGILRATDIDEGKNAQIMFVIKPEFEFSVPFVVFPDGTLKTNRQLDREERSKYEFTVVAFDQGTPRMKSSANVTIFVTDTNDNAPKLTFPVAKNKTVMVSSDVNPGYKVTQIEAKDMDEGVNTIMSYDIISGNEDRVFFMDARGGIYLEKTVMIKQNRTFHLHIAVKDGGHPQHTTESDLKIVMVRTVNGTSQLSGDDNNSNTLIVVIVVILTTVLSIVMIMVICFLRRFDHRSKARKNLDIVAPDEKYPKCYMEDPTQYLENGKDSHEHLTLSYDPMTNMTSVKRKEVSFDIDDHVDHSDPRDNHNTTMSTFSVPESEKLQGMSLSEEGEESVPNSKQGRLNKLQMLQYHQAILESQTRAWLQTQDGQEEGSSFDVTLPDDKYSDTSEEVTASDSGKGGSEDDIPSNHSKDLKNRVHGVIIPGKFQTRHYVAPEFRRQGSLQRKACDINFDDNGSHVHSPASPISDDLQYRPESRASLANSTPRPNSRAAMFYPNDHSFNRTLDSVGDHVSDWDSASYV